jgi:hypothetical protein
MGPKENMALALAATFAGARAVRTLVCGGRNYNDRRHLFEVLDRMHAETPITLIIEGEASGADRLARKWAEARGVPFLPFPAAWDDVSAPGAVVRRNRYGRLYDAAAGGRRNARMLHEGRPDRVVAFPGGSGTRDMMSRSWEVGINPIKAW